MEKHTIDGKVRTSNNRIFTIQKAAASEQDIQLHFDDAIEHTVVKLDAADLPSADAEGNRITWINNWGILDASGNYVENIEYTVFLPARENGTFVYQDRSGLKADKKPRAEGKRPAQAGMVQVEFDTGDPGVGYR